MIIKREKTRGFFRACLTFTIFLVLVVMSAGCGSDGLADGTGDIKAEDGKSGGACATCHGNPPAAPHPEATECYSCHSKTVKEDGTIDAEGGFHQNGTVESETGGSCDTCHGNPPDAPHPEATDCNTCHGKTVKADGTIDEEGGFHNNGTVEVDTHHPDGFSAPDQHGTEFNVAGPATCSSCHGDDLAGGTSGVSCEKCHASFRTNCTFCHGGTDNETGAPPENVAGEIDTGLASVGAHTAHLLTESTWHKTMDCATCHIVPADALDAGHIDGTVLHEWSKLATKKGSEPVWDGTTCSGVYCHGAASSGGTAPVPDWTVVDGSQSQCGGCHALPPTEGHPSSDDCSKCHGCVSDDTNAIRPESAQFHIDGKVNMEKEGECPSE